MLALSPLSFTSPDLLPTVPLGYTTRFDFPGPLVCLISRNCYLTLPPEVQLSFTDPCYSGHNQSVAVTCVAQFQPSHNASVVRQQIVAVLVREPVKKINVHF